MTTIRVKHVYEIPEKHDFVLVGEVEGSIGPGDFVRIPVTTEGNRMNFLVGRIVAEQGAADWEVHLRALPTLAEILRGIQLIGRTFEVEDFRRA